MSDSSPKLRSPIAAYGPVVVPVVIFTLGISVLFVLGRSKPPRESFSITEMTPPPRAISPKEVQKRMGYGDPDEARAEAQKLMKERGLSWFDLKPEDQNKLNKLTRGGGRKMYETVVSEERAKNPKK